MVVRVAEVEERRQHMLLSHISWDTFEKLLDEMGEVHRRVAFHRGDLEFMTVSLEHDMFGRWIGRLIFFIALEMKIPLRTGGATTLKNTLLEAGLEPDECFWTTHEKQMRGKKKWDAQTDPPPDLAVEIDITSSWLDRLGIYATLGVPEVWRYDGKKLRVLILGSGGKYRERAKSAAFPLLPIDGLVRFIARVEGAEETTLIQEFAAWLREDVLAKKPGGIGAKSTKKSGN